MDGNKQKELEKKGFWQLVREFFTDTNEQKAQKREEFNQRLNELIKEKYGAGDSGNTPKPPKEPLNPKSVKLVKYGFMGASVVFAIIAILVYKAGNHLLAVKISTSSILCIGVSLRPDVYLRSFKSDYKYLIWFLVLFAAFIAFLYLFVKRH